MSHDTAFLREAGIAPPPDRRDLWHWLRHRWSQWTEPYQQAFVGVGWLVHGQQWVEIYQDRWCLTCKQRQRRQVKWGA